MSTRFYCCSKCKETGSYAIDEHSGDTTFPRGEWLAHNDYITTGFSTMDAAKNWLKKDIAGESHI